MPVRGDRQQPEPRELIPTNDASAMCGLLPRPCPASHLMLYDTNSAPTTHITALMPSMTHSKTGGAPALPAMMEWMLSAMLRGREKGKKAGVGLRLCSAQQGPGVETSGDESGR